MTKAKMTLKSQYMFAEARLRLNRSVENYGTDHAITIIERAKFVAIAEILDTQGISLYSKFTDMTREELESYPAI